MRFAKLTPIVAILALAACDNEPTTADAPVIDEPGMTRQDTATAPDPVVEDNVTIVTPETTTDTATAPIEPMNSADQAETDVSVITPEAGGTATGGTSGAESTGALGAATGVMVDPGSYASDQLSLDLSEDGSFTLIGAGGDEVTGDWRVFDDIMTLSNADGAVGDASFPMTCNVAEEGEGFRISADTASCEMLDGQVFQPQG